MHNVWILPLVKLILTVMFEIRKQNLRPRAVVGYGVKIFGRGLFITSPDHLEVKRTPQDYINEFII